MITKITDAEFDLIKRFIETQCGIIISPDKKYLVETRLSRMLFEYQVTSFGAFYQKVVNSNDPKLKEKIVDAMTTNETLWFRDNVPWITFRDVVLPYFAELYTAKKKRNFRIWSAASSTGQEPYTIAMLIDTFHKSRGGASLSPNLFDITATDISTSALFIAMSGRYDNVSMNRGLVGEWKPYKDRYFTHSGRISEISKNIRERVNFKKFNLQSSFSQLGRFDIVFIRNVAIYFSDDFKKELFEKVASVLNPNGFLFLGTAENVSGYSNKFVAEKRGSALFFRLK